MILCKSPLPLLTSHLPPVTYKHALLLGTGYSPEHEADLDTSPEVVWGP